MFHGQHPLVVARPDLNWHDERLIWDLHVRFPAPRLDAELPGFPEYIGRLINTAIVKNPGQR